MASQWRILVGDTLREIYIVERMPNLTSCERALKVDVNDVGENDEVENISIVLHVDIH
jgi:hypothetical protein